MSDTIREPIVRDGEQYEFVAGPFPNGFDAYDFIETQIDYGGVAEDAFVVDEQGWVYRRIAAQMQPADPPRPLRGSVLR